MRGEIFEIPSVVLLCPVNLRGFRFSACIPTIRQVPDVCVQNAWSNIHVLVMLAGVLGFNDVSMFGSMLLMDHGACCLSFLQRNTCHFEHGRVGLSGAQGTFQVSAKAQFSKTVTNLTAKSFPGP